jgi:hypothetical protein
MERFGRLARFVAGAMTALFAGLQVAQAATCALADEATALNTRVLQSELMVAALTCGENARYGAFVKKFEPILVANGNALRHYFKRAYGGAGETRMNRMVTQLANAASMRSMGQGKAVYCASRASLFSEVLALGAHDLPAYVSRLSYAGDHGVRPCTQQAAGERAR